MPSLRIISVSVLCLLLASNLPVSPSSTLSLRTPEISLHIMHSLFATFPHFPSHCAHQPVLPYLPSCSILFITSFLTSWLSLDAQLPADQDSDQAEFWPCSESFITFHLPLVLLPHLQAVKMGITSQAPIGSLKNATPQERKLETFDLPKFFQGPILEPPLPATLEE